MEKEVKDMFDSMAKVASMKKEFPMYVVYLLRKALEGNKDIQMGGANGHNCKWSGTFIVNEPKDENGDEGAIYDFTIEKRRGK